MEATQIVLLTLFGALLGSAITMFYDNWKTKKLLRIERRRTQWEKYEAAIHGCIVTISAIDTQPVLDLGGYLGTVSSAVDLVHLNQMVVLHWLEKENAKDGDTVTNFSMALYGLRVKLVEVIGASNTDTVKKGSDVHSHIEKEMKEAWENVKRLYQDLKEIVDSRLDALT